MAGTFKYLLLTFAAVAALSACDDNGDQQDMARWFDWTGGKKNEAPLLLGYGQDYARETQAGNYLAGQFAQYQSDWKTASKYLDRAMQLDPDNFELRQKAMVVAMQAGDAKRAIVLARKVIEEDPKNLIALMFIAVDQIERQDYKGVGATLKSMPQNGIADFIRPILSAWASAPEKKLDKEGLIANGPLHAYHALLIADYIGQVKEPERYFINVLTGGGADTHTLEMMADVYNRQGNTELANKIYDTLLKESTMPPARAALILKKRGKPDLALASKIDTPAEGAAEAFYDMARVLYTEQSDETAIVFARVAQYLAPSMDDAKILTARIMVRSDHIEEAITLYKSIAPSSPDYAVAQRSAAELVEDQGKLEDSITFLRNIYAKDNDVEALIQIGDVYRRAEKFPEAIKAYNEAEAALGGKVSSDHWHLLYARGMSYERAGDMTHAEADLEAALQFRPDQPYLLNYLGYSWADQGKKLDKSLELIQKAATLKPDDGYIVDSLGWVHYKTGHYDRAVTELEKAVELVPYDATINDHLGDAYWQVGRKNEARFQWQRAMNNSKDDTVKAALEKKISDGLIVIRTPLRAAQAKDSAHTPGSVAE